MRMLSPFVLDDFDHVVSRFLRPTNPANLNFRPSYEVNETKDHYLISFDMPGVKKEDIRIEVENNQLVISGERESTTRYERTFALPTTVNVEKIEAHYENGVLNIAVPKAETAKVRTIPIKDGQSSFFSKLLGSKKETENLKEDAKVS